MKPELMKQLRLSWLLTGIVMLSISCKKEYSLEDAAKPAKDYNFTILFKPVVDTVSLKFDSSYLNRYNELYKVSAFKFYVSNIALVNTDSNISYKLKKEEYYLVDFSDSVSTVLKLKAVPFKYNRISLTIGVDSIHNVSGAQTGALDPAKGMFWTWNSGYIMAKLEGTSPQSNQTGNKIEYHIGGFKGPENAVRTVTLLYPFAMELNVSDSTVSNMIITANSNAWFYNPHEIKISNNPVCTTPGVMAKNISENYTKMFTVVEIKN